VKLLMRYCWETLELCVPPEIIATAVEESGFRETRCTLWFGVFSEYYGKKPAAAGTG
jgi:demethylmenaquinone methyltransferase / 2-methoxy-6-polyprenyl-1,4-benzoquinol methylase